ncbi:MAG: DUF4249 family protein [candidate division WOR-3 bacterium]|nr:MAG: DUF4249 family protein [candidate division WOR-3 bacterium]
MTRFIPPAAVAASLLLTAFSACELTPAEMFEPELNVHCLLVAEHDTAAALVDRTYAIDDPYIVDFRGASVAVWTREDTWEFRELGNSWYKEYRFAPPVPHDTYGIRVTHPDFDTVAGSTIVPDTFSLLHPRPGDTIDQNDSLVWSRSRSCLGYYMSMEQATRRDTFFYTIVIPNESIPGWPYDSLTERVPLVFLQYREEGPCTLRLCALDQNYFDWMSGSGQGLGSVSNSMNAGITGGVGVFGAAVQREVAVYYRSDTSSSIQSRRKSDPLSGLIVKPPTSRRLPSGSEPVLSPCASPSATGRVSPGPALARR